VGINPWKKFTPFWLYALLASSLLVMAASSEDRPVASRLLLIAFGLLSWSFGEYLMHRFAFHADYRRGSYGPIHALHLAHHDDPQGVDQLFVSFWMSAPVSIVYFSLGWIIFSSWQIAAYLFFGVSVGYLSYEFLHYKAHHGDSHLRVLRYLKKYHLLHHGETPNRRFGVTTPLFDCLFGTFESVSRRYHS